MKTVFTVLFILASCAWCEADRELAHIQVHEWGVLTINNGDPVLSSVPGTPSPVTMPDNPGFSSEPGLLRAPVLYFHGPAFSGTVTVKTNNGSIFDIYPGVPDEDRDHNHCTWTADFNYGEITRYPDSHGMAPGEWNYDLWRDVYSLSISNANGWNDKFLYYETAPESIDFLPYFPAKENLCEEDAGIEAVIVQRQNEGIFLAQCTLGDVVYGEDIEYTELESQAVLGILHNWSAGILEADEVEALWNTWSAWILSEYVYESGYDNGLLMYLIPDELTGNLSTISVLPDEVQYPVDITRYLLVAMPLQGEH
jgi:hypothetical protein